MSKDEKAAPDWFLRQMKMARPDLTWQSNHLAASFHLWQWRHSATESCLQDRLVHSHPMPPQPCLPTFSSFKYFPFLVP
jgi:hypothetical protein